MAVAVPAVLVILVLRRARRHAMGDAGHTTDIDDWYPVDETGEFPGGETAVARTSR
ncbi:hypothetical protein [Micromonospora sp. KC723]|uniref:hypothetical protein n=1 Tax=Micromonospora sp. KC723 TaxID=2530381 RepID=UPI0014044337|nr:hypothetical protein [Micromonospora sp. KC723]